MTSVPQMWGVRGIAWSPDGRFLAVASREGVFVWDALGNRATTLLSHQESKDVDWGPRGHVLTSVGSTTLDTWDLDAGTSSTIQLAGLIWRASVAWSPDGSSLAAGFLMAADTLCVWHAIDRSVKWRLSTENVTISDLAWSPDARFLASAEKGSIAIVLDAVNGRIVRKLKGHSGDVVSLAWASGGQMLATGSDDRSIRLWDANSGRVHLVLEGHDDSVEAIAFSCDGSILVSRADDTIRLWDSTSGMPLAILTGRGGGLRPCVAFHPTEPVLAVYVDASEVIEIWHLDLEVLRQRSAATELSVRYTTAKIPLVGDQLVGKTSLGHRLVTGEFKLFPRTHGQQFWTFPALSTRRPDGTECEAILWDLAGQPDYRLTHSLFLDDAHLALVVFNASEREHPLKGAEYWLKALRRRQGWPCPTILVAAQKDTGDVSLTAGEIDAFCEAHGVTGGYVATSAATGEGVDALIQRIREQVDWSQVTPTVTNTTFKTIKDFVLYVKERKGEGLRILVTPAELRRDLEAANPTFRFSENDMTTAVGHLVNHGFVTLLRTSAGDPTILLTPDLLINLTASLVLEARSSAKGLGALREADVLADRLKFPELQGLAAEERGVLLEAAVALFLEHNVCFRATLGADTLLVFPALINQRKPQAAVTPTVDDVSYVVEGPVEQLYSALVVLLGYTNTFARTNQWLNQAEYEMAAGQTCGFRQVVDREGETTLVLFYGTAARDSTRRLFEGLFETFLLARDLRVTKYPALSCPSCTYRQERDEVVKRIVSQHGFMFCAQCGEEISLPRAGERLAASAAERERLADERETASARTLYETALAHVKGVVRDRGAARKPSCFVSYAWGSSQQERWVAALVQDLQTADVEALLDRRDNASIGKNVARFVSDGVDGCDFVAVIATPAYVDKYANRNPTRGSMVAAEMDLIHQRLTGTEPMKETVLPVLLSGDFNESLPPLLRGRVVADFRLPVDYFIALFDLVLTIHAIPLADPAVADLREALRRRRRLLES